MLEKVMGNILENRFLRHGIFWLCWVFGFTFLKSLGESFNVYFAWLLYYFITLPLFVLHTYIVVYWVARTFVHGWKIILFVILFLLLLCLFSFIEILISEYVLSPFFPDIFTSEKENFAFTNVFISGVGNLYVLVVFVAAKMVRTWYLTNESEKMLLQRRLELRKAEVNAAVQPEMLLFAVSEIEKYANAGSQNVPELIALLSDMLQEVRSANERKVLRPDEELKNVKKVLGLYSLIFGETPPVVQVDNLDKIASPLPAFLLFSEIEAYYRARQCIATNIIRIEPNAALAYQEIEIQFIQDGLQVVDSVLVKFKVNRQ